MATQEEAPLPGAVMTDEGDGAAVAAPVPPPRAVHPAFLNDPPPIELVPEGEPEIRRVVSNPAIVNMFSKKDSSTNLHLRHDQSSIAAMERFSRTPTIGDVIARAEEKVHKRAAAQNALRALGNVEGQRLFLKESASVKHSEAQAAHAAKEKDLENAEGRQGSKASKGSKGSKGGSEGFSTGDKVATLALFFLSIVLVTALCLWSKSGLLGSDHIGHHISTKSRAGHMHSPLHSTPAVIALGGTSVEFFEVRFIGMATRDFSVPREASDGHRRLLAEAAAAKLREASSLKGMARQLASAASCSQVTSNITWQMYADGVLLASKLVNLYEDKEIEDFTEVDVGSLLRDKNIDPHDVQVWSMNVTGARSDEHTAFLMQVLRMDASGRHRKIIGIVIFVITFLGIVSEKVHRSYSAVMGASAALCCVSAIQETPTLHTIIGMIDWGTLMLLMSMMILVRMLAITGFFNWCALKVVQYSDQNPVIVYFALTNICGILSMFLDNVTCVMLFGPLTINLAQKMHLNPRPLYLAMTICATVGGTATQVGDPPNIVIGSKMEPGFVKFMVYNLPIVLFVLLPLSSAILYYRLRNVMYIGEKGETPRLDLSVLAHENRITDKPMFAKVSMVFMAVFLSLCLHPIHHIEPAWFTTVAMFACAILFEPHKFGKYLEFVEWDTLLFFALLFVLVESLVEMGVIQMLGDGIITFIELFPLDSRMSMAVIVILWVSGIGSAFLESLPYTITIVRILMLLRQSPIEGVSTEALVWPLSVGACVGGIGSIMGSSANLVCIAVANRYCDKEEYKVQGSDFLKHGLPTMLILVFISMFWQLFLFVGLEAESATPCSA